MSIHEKSKSIKPQDKLHVLKLLIEETQKYELLTTNQYLPQIELVVGILEELSKRAREKQSEAQLSVAEQSKA